MLSKLRSIILLILAAATVGFWLGRTTYFDRSDEERLVRLQQENGELKAAVEKLRSLRVTPEDRAGTRQNQESAPSPPSKSELSHIDDTGTIAALRESLALADKTVNELNTRAAEQQAQLEQLRQDQKRLAAVESQLNEQLASSRLLAETKAAELTRKTEELKQSETANQQLREDAAVARSKANRLSQTSSELQEIYRRRESYLNTLISRYREITEQYRAFVSVLENRRGPEGTPGGSLSVAGPELSRIQSSIALAEEDLRQLNSLNAQALRLQKKLSGN